MVDRGVLEQRSPILVDLADISMCVFFHGHLISDGSLLGASSGVLGL